MNREARRKFRIRFLSGTGVSILWYSFCLVLVNTNAQFLVHISDDLLFDIIEKDINLLDVLFRHQAQYQNPFLNNLKDI